MVLRSPSVMVASLGSVRLLPVHFAGMVNAFG